jgi:hypothetical protein
MDGGLRFSNGYFMTVGLLRDTAMSVEGLAGAVDLPVDRFLDELHRWAEGPGLPYGIRVDMEARRIVAPVR